MNWHTSIGGSKFHNQSTIYNGQAYHSKKEAGFAQGLDFLVKAKDLTSWERQIRFDFWLIKKGKNWILRDKKPPESLQSIKLASYLLDFIAYRTDGIKELIEVKGIETDVWKLKWKLLCALYEDNPQYVLRVVK